MSALSTPNSLSANSGWTLDYDGKAIVADFPNDIHSILLSADIIEDPYFRDREVSLDWVHQREWTISRIINVETLGDNRWTLTFDSVDCFTTVRVNNKIIGETQSQFVRYDFDVTDALKQGDNTVEVLFHPNAQKADEAREAFPFELPGSKNCRIPNINYIRKTYCHAGWDWNIAILPLGIYGDITLKSAPLFRLDELKVVQQHNNGSVTLGVSVYAEGFAVGETQTELTIDGQTLTADVQVLPGSNTTTLQVEIKNPKLWWPAGQGDQPLYDLHIKMGAQSFTRKIGLRNIELITSPDDTGARFAFAVNGREVFMRGSNWIPADALPARGTPEVVRDLLQSALDVHQNMIRIWGGGQYEATWFYDMCSELGILVWQDFMFACAHYPGGDFEWLNLVRKEATQQVRRLSSQPCLALWCGDNEIIGAMGWHEETIADRDRYLANYDRLNHTLETVIHSEAIDVPFWPSSPSVGRLNFSDGWHDDTSGDMHFWDVWHSAKDFEHYRTVRPRFCSEFGFQSFPSMNVMSDFTELKDQNVSSVVMDVHQRNEGGNGRIVETLGRYFRFPETFPDTVFLSQVSQALAMKTAIEFWRSNKPRTMGTLYWQLNDTWPVASWASLEYGGGWKTMHYLARQFFAPTLVTAQPDPETSDIVFWAVCDTPEKQNVSVEVLAVTLSGGEKSLGSFTAEVDTNGAIQLGRIAASDLAEDAFIHFKWSDGAGKQLGENDYFPRRYKTYDVLEPTIETTLSTDGEGREVLTLTTDVPALFVTINHGNADVLSDNCFTLLPGRPKSVYVERDRAHAKRENEPSLEAPVIQYLKGF